MGEWKQRKEYFINRLKRELKEGRVDIDILPLLESINELENFYTTSSCSGRIQVYCAELPGDKFGLKTLVKWHRVITTDELKEVLRKSDCKNIWLAVLPPIIHVVAKDVESANLMLHIARDAGFKHSGILSVKPERIVIEITGSERIELPIKLNNTQIVPESALEDIVRAANEMLKITKKKLSRLRRNTCRLKSLGQKD